MVAMPRRVALVEAFDKGSCEEGGSTGLPVDPPLVHGSGVTPTTVVGAHAYRPVRSSSWRAISACAARVSG